MDPRSIPCRALGILCSNYTSPTHFPHFFLHFFVLFCLPYFCIFYNLPAVESKYDSVDDHVNEGQAPVPVPVPDPVPVPVPGAAQNPLSLSLLVFGIGAVHMQNVSVDAKSKDHTGSITTNDMETRLPGSCRWSWSWLDLAASTG